ncbi:MAG: P-II family nitrogen regulator [Rhodothermales bacterium]
MKEIKAYVRCEKVDEVIDALERVGIEGITVIDVMGLGVLADPHSSKYSMECVERYSKIAKLEVVARNEDVHRIVETVRESAYTGTRGDGLIFVTAVEMAVKVRTGAVGEAGL